MSEVSSTPQSDGTGKVRRKKSSIKIDMTPMVDLAFLLLTFFILTSVLNDPYVINIEMPEKRVDGAVKPIAKDRLMTIVLGGNDVVYWYMGVDDPELNASNFSASGIRKVLLEKKASIDKLYVFIKPSKESRYKNMVDILDEMLITEITNYSLLKASTEDSQLMAKFKSAQASR